MSTEVTGAGAAGESREESRAAEEDIRQEALGLCSLPADLNNSLLRRQERLIIASEGFQSEIWERQVITTTGYISLTVGISLVFLFNIILNALNSFSPSCKIKFHNNRRITTSAVFWGLTWFGRMESSKKVFLSR